MKCTLLATLLVLVLTPELAAAATITVRKDGTGDYMVLQQALDVAASGDTVLVGPGEYTESSIVRLNGNGFDVEVFGRVRTTTMTIIGSGMGVTIIGPVAYSGSAGQLTPKCIAKDAVGGWLRISDLTLRNCYEGMYVDGVLYADRCEIMDNYVGIVWFNVGSGGRVKDTMISATAPPGIGSALSFGHLSQGSDITIENCHLGWPSTVRGVQNLVMRDCNFNGLSLYSGADVYMERCIGMLPYGGVGMVFGGGSYCEIRDSELRSAVSASPIVIDLDGPGGRFVVENCLIEGGSTSTVYLGSGAGPCEIHNCDLVKGSGPMVECAFSTAQVTHDLSNNWWGTTSETEIQAWIYDRADNPGRGGLVNYSPFAGQSVPIEATSWGELKALFR